MGKDTIGISYEGDTASEIASYVCRIVTTTLNPNYTLGEQTIEVQWRIVPRVITFVWEILDNSFSLGFVTPNGSAAAVTSIYDGAPYRLVPRPSNLVEGHTIVNMQWKYNLFDPEYINAGLYTCLVDIDAGLTGTNSSTYTLEREEGKEF